MIPFQGLIAFAFSVFALVRFWHHPLPVIWWVVFGLAILDLWNTSAFKTAIREYGTRHRTTLGIGIICTFVQLALIALGVYSVFRPPA